MAGVDGRVAGHTGRRVTTEQVPAIEQEARGRSGAVGTVGGVGRALRSVIRNRVPDLRQGVVDLVAVRAAESQRADTVPHRGRGVVRTGLERVANAIAVVGRLEAVHLVLGRVVRTHGEVLGQRGHAVRGDGGQGDRGGPHLVGGVRDRRARAHRVAVGGGGTGGVGEVDDLAGVGRATDVAVVARVVLAVGTKQVIRAFCAVDGMTNLALVGRGVIAAVRAEAGHVLRGVAIRRTVGRVARRRR